jgi:hypothetical protein
MSNEPATDLQILITSGTTAFSNAGRTQAVLRNATEALSDLGAALKATASGFLQAVDGIAPDEVELELNLSLEAEGKWLIVAGKAGATAGVKLIWKRRAN